MKKVCCMFLGVYVCRGEEVRYIYRKFLEIEKKFLFSEEDRGLG